MVDGSQTKLKQALKPEAEEELGKVQQTKVEKTIGKESPEEKKSNGIEKKEQIVTELYTDEEKTYALFHLQLRRIVTNFARKVQEAIPKRYRKNYYGTVELSWTKGDIHVSKQSYHFKPLRGRDEIKDKDGSAGES